MSFANLKIASKLIGAFAVVALLGGALGLYAIGNMNTLNDADTALYENE
ncbi:MCP four helix bundle domain-containing protein, partial [Leptospira sp. SA-E8]